MHHVQQENTTKTTTNRKYMHIRKSISEPWTPKTFFQKNNNNNNTSMLENYKRYDLLKSEEAIYYSWEQHLNA